MWLCSLTCYLILSYIYSVKGQTKNQWTSECSLKLTKWILSFNRKVIFVHNCQTNGAVLTSQNVLDYTYTFLQCEKNAHVQQ